MAIVLNRETRQLLRSVNSPDYSVETWIVNPDLSNVTGFESKYWAITGDSVSLMSPAEMASVDAAEEAARISNDREEQKARLDKERLLKGMVLWVRDELNELRFAHGLPERTPAEIKAAIKIYVEQV